MKTQNLKKRKNNHLKDRERPRVSKVSSLTNCTSPKQKRKLAVEEDIKALKQQMEFILGVTKTGLDIIDSEFNVRYIDPEWAKVYGDSTGKKCYQYFMDRSEMCPGCGIPTSLKTKMTIVTEEVLTKEGNRPIQVTTIPFQNNSGEWLVAEVNVDISERKSAEKVLRKAYDEMETRVQERTAELVQANNSLNSEVNERKHIERELKESETKYRELTNSLPEAVYEADENGKILFANRCALEIFGYTQEDFDKGLSLFEMVIPEEQEKVRQNLLKLLQGEKIVNKEYTALRKDGSTFPILASVNPIVRNNKFMGIRGVVVDITERKKTEDSLSRESTFRTSIIEHATEGLCVCHETIEFPHVAFTVWNDRMTEITGYSMDEINRLGWYQTMYPDPEIQTRAIERMARMRQGDNLLGEGWEITRADGEKRLLSISTSVLQTGDGISHVLNLMHDITEHKKADEMLRQSEEKYRTILENITDGYFEVDIAGNFTFLNDSLCQLLGYSKDELMGMNNRQYTDQENSKKLYQVFNGVFRTGEPAKEFDWAVIRKDGTKRFGEVSVSLMKDANDQPIGFRGIARDVTQRKQVEEALRKSEEKYRLVSENIPVAVYSALPDEHSTNLFISGKMEELTGYPGHQLIEDPELWMKVIHPEDREQVWREIEKHRRERKPLDIEYRLMTRDNITKWIKDKAIPALNEKGEIIRIDGFMEDITEHKRAEEALRESEERYRTILENIEDGYYEVDLPGNFTFFNDSLCRMLGYSKDEMLGMGNQRYTDPENHKKLFQAFNEAYRKGEPVKGFDWEVFRKDGTKLFSEVSVSIIKDSKGQPIGFRGIARDITQRKNSEEALRLSEKKYRELYQNLRDGSAVVNMEGKIVEFNEAFQKMLGYEKEEIYKLTYEDITPKKWHPIEDQVLRDQVFKKGYSDIYEKEYRKKDGTIFPVNLRTYLIQDENGTPIGMWAFVRDISEQKQAEESLRSERQRLASLAENSPFGMVMIDQGGNFRYMNPKFRELFGYDLTDVPDGKTWFRKAYPNPTYRHQVISEWLDDSKSFKSGEKRARIFTVTCKDGAQKNINFIPVQLETGENLMACEDITERKRAEEALRESEERYRTILENIEDGYFEVDLPGNFTFFNDSLCRILGYSREEMIGMGNQQYTDEENRKKLFQAFNKVYNTGKSIKGFDWKVFRKDGTKLFGEVSVSLIKDSKGQSIGFRGIARDITERKQAEETLLESKANLVGVLESTADGILAIDNQGKVITSNSRFVQLWRIPQELLEQGNDDALLVFVLDQLLDPEAFLARVQALYDSDKEDNDVILFKDGRVFERYSRPLASESRMMGRVWSFRDITEHKQAEEALRRSEESSKELAQENAIMAEIGRIISSTLNIDEVYERFNEEVNKLISFDRISVATINPKSPTVTIAYAWGNKIDGRIQGDVFPIENTTYAKLVANRSGILIQIESEDELKAYPHLLNTFRAGFRSTVSVPLISKNEVIGGLNFRSLIPNNYTEIDLNLAEKVGHQIAGAIANAQLFKELMQAEEDKIAIQEQFRQSQKMEAIGGLAGGIAHDFNNLLTVIKGYAELSCLGLDTSDPLRGNIEEILKASERATNLTRQLLAFSRRQILDFKVINLNTLLKDLDKMLHRILGEDIALAYHLPEDIGKVKTDPGQIEQVILNLAVNSRDAMPSGGKLTIETLNVELDEAYARTHMGVSPGQYVMLSVSDTGAGIDSKIRERIFEPFFTTKEKGKGTGLGLSTVYGIVKQSGGNIYVYTEPGLGTTFKIYLPRVEEEENHLQRKDLDISVSRGNETILLVEDEQSVRELAARILRDRGYQVYEAHDGNNALNMVQSHPERKFHLLLTDVVMPGMSGKELADRLKLTMPDLKVLFISGYTDNAIVHHGVLDKGVNFIQKPFTPESLARKLREVLDRS